MTKRKSIKLELTEVVLAELPKHVFSTTSITSLDAAMARWWATGRQDGLRLTDDGNTAFSSAEIEYFDFEFKPIKEGWYGFILELNKKIRCPYFIGVQVLTEVTLRVRHPYIRLYDSRIAMMVQLYGNIEDYLVSIKLKERK